MGGVIVTAFTFENLFSILPRGVVSKKDIGARRMALRTLLWRVCDANIAPRARVNDPIKTKIAWPIPSVV